MILKIKERLYNQKDLIIEILNELGVENINPNLNSREIRWGGKNGSKINIDTLSYVSFSHNHKGDILTLVSLLKNIKLGESIKWLANRLNISYLDIEKVDIKLPFGGFWKGLGKTNNIDETPPRIYNKNRLDEFNIGVSQLFIKDGISAKIQEEFHIGYDCLTNRITIPWLDEESNLIGIMGRLNKEDLNEKESKYLPIIPFRKSKALYGFNVNYQGILENNCVIVCESEKSVLKAKQYGFNNVIALGGNEIHSIPQKLIKSMYCNVVIALDEGLEMQHYINQAKKVQINNPFFTNEVYILDMSDLPHKSCIFDLDYKIIGKAFKERLIYID